METPHLLLWLIMFGCLTNNCLAQETAVFKGDTLHFEGHRYYPKQVVTLDNGSGRKNNFSFVWLGTSLNPEYNAGPSYARQKIGIIKLVQRGGRYFLLAKCLETSLGKCQVDLAGALENGEIKVD